jgi:hypothetical protein
VFLAATAESANILLGGHTVSKDEITLEIATPKGIFTRAFSISTKVEEVIEAVVKAQELARGDAFELMQDSKALEPKQKSLGEFHLVVKLELVATGSGV